MSWLEEMEKRIDRALPPDGMTRLVKIGPGILDQAGRIFRELFPGTPALVTADVNTFPAAGEKALASLKEAGCEVLDPFVYSEKDLHAETSQVDRLRERLASTEAVVLCVGSGTLNDLAKLASHQVGRPYMTAATAASVDGYTAYGASITDKGFKQTFYCPAPMALVADLEVIAAAPKGMNPSGYADLLAKIPAGADWILADALGAEPIHGKAWSLVQDRLREWLEDPEGVALGGMEALGNLMEGLVFSGLAMLGATLTLPGIAGIILSIGMAVDANVLIFERMREEFELGKSVKSGVDSGFNKAFWSIVDSQVTTLITAMALFMFGTLCWRTLEEKE